VSKFDPSVIREQIENLLAERERIDRAIVALQDALRNIQGLGQRDLELLDPKLADVTLHDAVKRVCMNMVDGITRQRVVNALERSQPLLRPKSASVAATLINLAKGDKPMLRVVIEGRGRSPSFYSTEGDTIHRLSSEEVETLLDESAVKGVGGWQSLWSALQKRFDKSSGSITLTPELRARIYHYYHSYGQGGWQNRVMKVFRRELPHLFAT